MKIHNVPEYAKEKKYLVVRIIDGESWFYGSWNDINKAVKQATEIGGVVFPAKEDVKLCVGAK